MKHYLITFYLVFLLSGLNAQPVFQPALPEFELSLISFEFYNNDSNYRKNKVSEVFRYCEYGSQKQELIYHESYDKNGFLVKRINYDTVIRSKEVINIKRDAREDYYITRKIKKSTLQTISLQKNIPDFWMKFPSDWRSYLEFKKQWINSPDSFIHFKATYTFSKDSTVLAKSYVNEQLIETTKFPSTATIAYKNNQLEKCCTSWDSILVNDTTVIVKKQNLEKGNTKIVSTYIYKGLTHRVRYEDFIDNELFFFYENKYYYTDGGELMSAILLNPGSFEEGKTVIKYNVSNIYDSNIGWVEDVYGADDKVRWSYKYDKSGRRIEFFFPSNPGYKELVRYEYYPNDLLKEITTIIEDKVRYRTIFEYKYY